MFSFLDWCNISTHSTLTEEGFWASFPVEVFRVTLRAFVAHQMQRQATTAHAKSFIEKRHGYFSCGDDGDDTVPTEQFSCGDGDNDVTGHPIATVFLPSTLLQFLCQAVPLLMLVQPLQKVSKKFPNSLEAGQLF